MTGMSRHHMQSDYSKMHNYLKHQYHFIKRINTDVGPAFGKVEYALQDNFIPSLVKCMEGRISGREVAELPVKQVGLVILDLHCTPQVT